ncbi:hypothetical protein [Phaffia rhodozyma]|uniref:Large ribosomal subunit protein mL59 domain-containing protein n=1 Tax=Phaffia rhodozyma TaxID=264483 RepID=A0A0F7SRH9_PHARH|nr:hypothetical protein [Phaffia rhodozyma]
MPSLSKLQRLHPGKSLIRTVESLGLRLGQDKIPPSLKKSGVVVPIWRKKNSAEPHWHKATVVLPHVELVDKPFKETRIGAFMNREWRRKELSDKYKHHEFNHIPEGQIRNPFIPWFNPVIRRFESPIYTTREQRRLVEEARRLNITDVLPSGPKTPPEFANTFMDVWKETGKERTRTELGRIIWAGVYKKKLNPWGEGRFTEDRLSPEKIKEREVVEGLPRWGPYKGRQIMFKGSLPERQAPAKKAATQARLDTMDQRIAAWKKEKAAEKEKAKSSLPY